MENELRDILISSRIIAIVGLSASPDRTSYHIGSFLKEMGYHIIPVNPTISTALGEKSYASLRDVPEKVDIVNVFRRSEDVLPIAEDCINIGARVLWLQEGIINNKAAERARSAGIKVVMDRCIMKTYRHYMPDVLF